VSKLVEDVRIAILGATAGLFSSSVTLLIARIDSYYAWRNQIDDVPYERGIDDLWWVPVCVWHILLSVAASLLVHRYLANRCNSPFLLWQTIGITSLVGWVLTFALVIFLRCVVTADFDFARTLSPVDVALTAKYVSTAFACNVVYSSVINASSRQYAHQLHSQLALEDRVNNVLPS